MLLSPVLFGAGKSAREFWFYFTEDELTPGAVRWHNYKFVFKLRGDDGARTGGLAVDTNLGWKGATKHVATVPQVFDLWQDPWERYDILMNNYTGRTWMAVVMGEELKKLMKTYVQYPPRKLQSLGYTGPVAISNYQRGFANSLRRKALTYRCRRATGIRLAAYPMLRLFGIEGSNLHDIV